MSPAASIQTEVDMDNQLLSQRALPELGTGAAVSEGQPGAHSR